MAKGSSLEVLYQLAQVTPTTGNDSGENAIGKNPETEQGIEPESEFERLLDKELKGGTEPENTARPRFSWVNEFIKTLFGLGFIILLLGLVRKYYLFKKDFQKKTGALFHILHEQPVAPGKTIQVIEVGGKMLLIGVSDAGIQLITEIKDKPAIDQIKIDINNSQGGEKPDFLVELSSAIIGKVQGIISPDKKKPKPQAGHPDNEDISRLRSKSKENLDQIKKQRGIFSQLED